jgi:hypothetical protein
VSPLYDRLFTSFVSSTYRDLVEERDQVRRYLIENQCFPLGMEIFPSTGAGQWSFIKAAIDAADFCVFIVAGSFGSIWEDGVSWTQREFRYARERDKPMVVMVHERPEDLPAVRRETDPARFGALEGFRRELMGDGLNCRTFSDLASLVRGVGTSMTALLHQDHLQGWSRTSSADAAPREADFDRTYELIELSWEFTRSAARPDRWDASYRSRRILSANWNEGLERLEQQFSRDSDLLAPFGPATVPRLALVDADCTREYGGTIRLGEPRCTTGSVFKQDVLFNPPGRFGERLDVSLVADLPEYKHAYREDLLAATALSRSGPRAFDWASREISFPTRRLVYTAFLPDDLGACPKGFHACKSATLPDRAEHDAIDGAGGYSESRAIRQGVEGTLMRLDVSRPRSRYRYRLCWDLPTKGGG